MSGLVLGVFKQEFVSVSAMVDKFRPPVQAGFVLVANCVELFQQAKVAFLCSVGV